MTEAVQHKVSLGIFAGIFGVILAALLGMTPSPAQAADLGSTPLRMGGLVFTAPSGQGVTDTVIEMGSGDNANVVIIYGDADITVTQEQVAGGTRALAVQLGTEDNPYIGNITFNNVTLAGATSGVKCATIYSMNTVAEESPSADNSGATITLNNCTITSQTGQPAVSIGNGLADDQLIITNGTEITAAIGQNAVVVPNTSQASEDDPVVIEFENGGGTITGGSYAPSGNLKAAIYLLGTYVSIQMGSDGQVIGAAGSVTTAGDTQTANLAGVGIATGGASVTIEGESTLNVTGGKGTNQVGPEANKDVSTGNAAMSTFDGGQFVINGPGIVNAIGGSGSDVNAAGLNQGYGGTAISLGGTSSRETLVINGGTLNANGGQGGSTNKTIGNTSDTGNNGQGGNGIALHGSQQKLDGDAGTIDWNSTIAVNGGMLNVYGGNSGTNTATAGQTTSAPGAVGIAGIEDDAAYDYITIQQSSTAESAPFVTILGGLGNAKADGTPATYAAAMTNIGENGGNFNVHAEISGANPAANWTWALLTNTAEGSELSDTPVLQGFAGMDLETPYESMQALVTNTSEIIPWVQVRTATLESVTAGVVNVAGDQSGYIVAETNETMTGSIPRTTEWVYEASLNGVFSGLDGVDTSKFGSLTDFAASKAATFDPAENVSTNGVDEPDTQFYVIPTATGNELDITLNATDTNLKNSAPALNKIYPNLTVGAGEVPVVYTVQLAGGPQGGPTGGFPQNGETAVNNWTVYTCPEGDGTLVFGEGAKAGTPGTPTWDAASDAVELTTLPSTETTQKISNAAGDGTVAFKLTAPTAPAGLQFLGWFDETADETVTVPVDMVAPWSGNAYLTAEWGSVTLEKVEPTPVQVAQGSSIEVNAIYNVVASNKNLANYNMQAAGVNLAWNDLYINVQDGSGSANGISVETTNSTTEGDAPNFTVTLTATVTANGTADLGHYRVWPDFGNDQVPMKQPDGSTKPSVWDGTDNGVQQAKYATVEVVAGAPVPEGDVVIWRLSNPNSGEHIYTADVNEANYLDNVGWDPEGIAWVAPASSSRPIYRVYNPNNGDHMYTISLTEYNGLKNAGWNQEGVVFYSANQDQTQIYRLYNPNMTANGGAYNHLWTGDFNEYRVLGDGPDWKQEGVAWNAVALDIPAN